MMEETKKLRVKDFLCGAILAFAVFCVFFALCAIAYSEMKDILLALKLASALSAVSAGLYAVFEILVFKDTGSSSFSIGYFGTMAVFSAAVFFAATIFPVRLIFDLTEEYNSGFLKLACFRLCLFNSAALVVRLGFETARYLKRVFSGNI